MRSLRWNHRKLIDYSSVLRDDVEACVGLSRREAMHDCKHESVDNDATLSWLENAIEYACAQDQAKLLAYLESVRNELTEMAFETKPA
jgi:hypothetical protein